MSVRDYQAALETAFEEVPEAHKVIMVDPADGTSVANIDTVDYNTKALNVIAHAPEGLGVRDAFSRLRVSNPVTLFSVQTQYDDGSKDQFYYKTTTGGSYTHLPDQSSVLLEVDATPGASVIKQSQRYIRYQPGKSQLIFITCDFIAEDTGTKRQGYFDDENGVYMQRGFVHDLSHEHCSPSGAVGITCNEDTPTHVLSIRPKTLFNSMPNRGEYVPDRITFYIDTKPAMLQLYHGATITGGTWTSSDAESGIEYNNTATGFTGGHLVDSMYGAATKDGVTGVTEASNRMFLTIDIDGNNIDSSNYTIVGEGLGGNALVYANIHWTEVK
jgi:hypothetical protein